MKLTSQEEQKKKNIFFIVKKCFIKECTFSWLVCLGHNSFNLRLERQKYPIYVSRYKKILHVLGVRLNLKHSFEWILYEIIKGDATTRYALFLQIYLRKNQYRCVQLSFVFFFK